MFKLLKVLADEIPAIIEKTEELKILKGIDWIFAIILPIAIIFAIAFYVGYERQNVGKAAGISAHILVGLASTALAIMQRLMFIYLQRKGAIDGSGGQRVIAQIVTGVSFIGAGVVMKNERTIKGITTAATIWTIAALGIILGSGYLILGSIIGIIIILFMLCRDLLRGVNPFKPTNERIQQIKKYSFTKVENKHILSTDDEDIKDIE